jgi:HAMP domain-containing protein
MEPRQRTGRLQRKFLIALLIVGIVPGVAALIVTYLYSTYTLKFSIGSGFQEIARSTAIRIAAAVDTEIDRAQRLGGVPMLIRGIVGRSNSRYAGKSDAEIRRILAAEAADWPISRYKGTRLRAIETIDYLRDWVERTPYYVRVVIADRHGALVASSDPLASYLNAGSEWWQETIDQGRDTAYVSSLHFDPLLKEYVFEVAVPIVGDDQEDPIGVVGLVIRREVLLNTILPIRIGETGHGMLLDTDGTPLICPVLPPTAHLIPDVLVNLLARDQPLWFVAEDDAHGGHDSIVGAAPVRFSHRLTPASLGGERWFAFVRQQPEETYAPINSMLFTVGIIGFGLVVVLASAGFVVGRRIVGPILALRRETEALRHEIASLPASAAGAPSETRPAPIEIRTGDEIEDLARTFQAMRQDPTRGADPEGETGLRRPTPCRPGPRPPESPGCHPQLGSTGSGGPAVRLGEAGGGTVHRGRG